MSKTTKQQVAEQAEQRRRKAWRMMCQDPTIGLEWMCKSARIGGRWGARLRCVAITWGTDIGDDEAMRLVRRVAEKREPDAWRHYQRHAEIIRRQGIGRKARGRKMPSEMLAEARERALEKRRAVEDARAEARDNVLHVASDKQRRANLTAARARCVSGWQMPPRDVWSALDPVVR